ncbi:Cytochrome p450 [Thalictrum thalictroides]|uniref:Cytochrome p450 n=1 Tax=Thalictrum thalictroides TaxID=46969 RepID=A0A7J6WAC4_THATH|nr:Cytochrome p450 [Thalictrum thalictroides]
MQLLPFGSGRRKCPGLELGLKTVQLLLAQLLHCFNWELPDGMSPANIEMKEVYGLTIRRATPLLLRPTYRLTHP